LGVRAVVIVLFVGVLWNLHASFLGIAAFFDLAINFRINPTQFLFGAIATALIVGFVFASHMIWNLASDIPALIAKGAWIFCALADLFASWQGTAHFVYYEGDVTIFRGAGLFVVSALIVASTMLLSKLLLGKDIKGKPFLF
jgi:hypothetical protein